MQVNVKLYASLAQYLPDGADKNQARIEVADGTTPLALMRDLNIPDGSYKLVLVNGIFVGPEERESRPLAEGDTLAVWPPVAGG